MKKYLFFFILTFSSTVNANLLLKTSSTFWSADMGNPSKANITGAYSRTGAYLGFNDKSNLYFGAGMLLVNNGVTTNNNQVYQAQDMFFGIDFSLFKGDWLWFGYSFVPTSKASYTPSDAVAETWTGSASVFSLAFYAPNQGDLLLGFSIDYYVANFTSKALANGTTSSVAEYGSLTVPTLSVGYSF